MQYQVVLEHDPETKHYTATVAGLPGLFVDAETEEEALRLVTEAIGFYLEELKTSSRPGAEGPHKPLPSKVVTVDV
ncbi:MAG: type II toxin-antitoxin system HicB family antitoxin [Thermoplasmata archaeon]